MHHVAHVYPATVTLLTMVLYFWTMWRVGQARAKHGVMPPRTDGPEEFVRIFRAQQNTTEQIVLFLPTLWLFALCVSPVWSGVLGMVWVVMRVWYVLGYSKASEKRMLPFLFALLTSVVMLLGAAVGLFGAWSLL